MRAASRLLPLRKRAAAWALGLMILATPAASQTLMFDTLDLPPFGFMSNDGRVVGSTFDIANAIAAEAKIEIDNALVPLSRIVRNLQHDKPTCTIITRSSYSEDFSILVADIQIQLEGGAIALKGTKLGTYNDLQGLVVGLTHGTHFEHTFDTDTQLTKHFLDNDGQVAKMLQMNRIDAAVGSLEALKYNFANLGVPLEELGSPLIFVQRDFWLHCAQSLQKGDLFERLRTATERLHRRGVIQNIWKRYE